MTVLRRVRPLINVVALAGLCAGAVSSPALAQASVPASMLTPHRAVYDLTLVEARDRAGIRSISGRLVYEFARRDCRFVLTYRQVMAMKSGEGQGGVLDFRSTTDEADSSRSFSFQTSSTMAGEPGTTVGGVAERGASDAIRVMLRQPEAKNASVPAQSLFPTQHLRRVLAAAEAGEMTLVADVFDGGEPADVASPSVTFIGAAQRPGEGLPAGIPAGMGMDKLRHWPVTISYFDRAAADSEQTPKFVFGADLYENGIAGSLRLDYGNFVVAANMVSLEPLPAGECPAH